MNADAPLMRRNPVRRRSIAAIIILLAVMLLAVVSPVALEANPFTSGDGARGAPQADTREPAQGIRPVSAFEGFAEFGPPRTALGAWLRTVQRNLTVSLADMLRNVQRGEADGTFWLILSLSFVYGVVHSLLPGHRKVLLFSYFMAERAPPIMGVVAGTALAVVHASAAIIVVLVTYFLIEASVSTAITRVGATVQIITASVLLSVGIILFILKVREARHGHNHDHSHPHNHDHSHPHSHDQAHKHHDELPEYQGTRRRRLLPVIIISGIVPCPGSSMILLFAVSLGAISLGLIAVGAFAVGMALSFSGLSVATIMLKQGISGVLDSPRGHALHHGIEIGSAALMVLFGLFLVLPALL